MGLFSGLKRLVKKNVKAFTPTKERAAIGAAIVTGGAISGAVTSATAGVTSAVTSIIPAGVAEAAVTVKGVKKTMGLARLSRRTHELRQKKNTVQGQLASFGSGPEISSDPGMGASGMMGNLPAGIYGQTVGFGAVPTILGAIRSTTGKIISFVMASGAKVSRKKAVALAKEYGPLAAAAALGVTTAEIMEAIVTDSQTKRRRRRGITAANLATTKRTINTIKSMAVDIGIRKRTCRT